MRSLSLKYPVPLLQLSRNVAPDILGQELVGWWVPDCTQLLYGLAMKIGQQIQWTMSGLCRCEESVACKVYH